MGKKVTSSSPIKTLAFDAIPNYWTYANTVTKHKPPTVDAVGGVGGDYYAAPNEPTTGGSNLGDTGPDIATDPCAGLTGDALEKRKGEKRGTPTTREQRLLDRISKSKNPAQIARLEKRLGGHLWREDKAMARKEHRAGEIGKGKTFFGRLIQGGENLFKQDPHKRHEHLRTASGTAKNPDSKARERSLTKINLGKARAKCNSDDTKEWDRSTDTCKDKPKPNPNANNPSNNKNQTATPLPKYTNPKACNYGGGNWLQGKCYKR